MVAVAGTGCEDVVEGTSSDWRVELVKRYSEGTTSEDAVGGTSSERAVKELFRGCSGRNYFRG